jgi:hypothetical protein
MFTQILEDISGIGIYPLISLFVFFLFFTGMFIWVLKSDKEKLNSRGLMPLNNDNATETL